VTLERVAAADAFSRCGTPRAQVSGVGNALYANDTSGLRPGAVPLSHEHLFVYCGCGA
jgi:hypothetical protein